MNTTHETSPRILITRLSHIGDCVLTLPLACAIKRAYPNSWIGWTLESPTHKLLQNHPCIDELIVVEKGLAKKPWKWGRLRKQLRASQYDIAIDPQSLTKSSLIGWLSGASTRLGFSSPYGRELSTLLNNQFVKTEHEHLVDRTLDFLGHSDMGVSDRSVEFRLPIAAADQESMAAFLRSQKMDQFVAINPGASWDSKRWVTKRFGFVARYAYSAFEVPTVVTWAGNAEKQLADEIVSESRGAAVLAPPTSLGELAAILKRSMTFIGCDTGPLHIAAATGCPCIGLHGPTLPTRSGAYGPDHLAVQRWHQSDRNRRRGENLAMRDITVEDVCMALDQMMARLSQPLQRSTPRSAA